MKIRIDGGVVGGWSGSAHELVPNGSVLIAGTIEPVGTEKSQSAKPASLGHAPRQLER